MVGAIGSLTAWIFSASGVPPGTPSLGELLYQAKNNLDAWWARPVHFRRPGDHPLLLVLIGDALRDALDPPASPERRPAMSLLESGAI